jgi:hypothetical protein
MNLTTQQLVERIEEMMKGNPLRFPLIGAHHLRPTHIHEIAERTRELEAINRLKCQLKEPWRGPDERFCTEGQWCRWRSRLKPVVKFLRDEKEELAKAVKQSHQRVMAGCAGVYDRDDPLSLIQASYDALQAIKKRLGWEALTEQERLLVDVLLQHLHRNVPVELPPSLLSDDERGNDLDLNSYESPSGSTPGLLRDQGCSVLTVQGPRSLISDGVDSFSRTAITEQKC